MIWKRQNHTEILEVLGEGLTSRVYKAIRKNSILNVQQVVALKVLHSTKLIHSLKNEIELLLTVDSPNCVKMLGWEETPKGLALVLEFLDGISLEELCRHQQLDTLERDEITFQIQEGLRELHKKNIIHGDISLKNIFVTTSGVLKIIDFGFSSREEKKCDYGTPMCMSPEAWAGEQLVSGSDLYSLGLLREHLKTDGVKNVSDFRNWQAQSQLLSNQNSLLVEAPEERSFLNLDSNSQARLQIAEYVKDIQKYQKVSSSTIKLVQDFCRVSPLSLKYRKIVSLFIAIFASVSVSAVEPLKEGQAHKKLYNLDVRSRFWVSTSLYKKMSGKEILYHEGYVPVFAPSLPHGEYVLRWTSQDKSGMIKIHMNDHTKIVIDVPN